MKILFIGNSFSQDAGRYLYDICRAGEVDAEFLNLIIGGCSFERHADCIENNKRDYMIQYNGHDYGEQYFATIDEGLEYRDWDYVSIQQVSGCSGRYETFHPYVDTLVAKIKEKCPRAKILLHMTWAYEWGSQHAEFPHYSSSPEIMTEAIIDAYSKLEQDINAYAVIPCGRVIAALKARPEFNIREGGTSLHRDTFHLGNNYGRYAAAATWYQWMGLGDIRDNTFIPTDGGEVDTKKLEVIKNVVAELVTPNK